MILYVSFGQTYWEKQHSSPSATNLAECGSKQPNNHMVLDECLEEMPQTIIIVMLTTSSVLSLASFFYPMITASFIYLETCWVLLDTVFVLHSDTHQNALD